MPPTSLSSAPDRAGESRAGVAASLLPHAVVLVGDVETSYRRFGHGTRVILLLALDCALREADSLPPWLKDRARVVIADHTTIAALASCGHSEESPFGRWLRGFLEGIGAREACVVAPCHLAAELERFDALNPGVLARRVLVGGAGDVATECTAHLSSGATWDAIWQAALAEPHAMG